MAAVSSNIPRVDNAGVPGRSAAYRSHFAEVALVIVDVFGIYVRPRRGVLTLAFNDGLARMKHVTSPAIVPMWLIGVPSVELLAVLGVMHGGLDLG